MYFLIFGIILIFIKIIEWFEFLGGKIEVRMYYYFRYYFCNYFELSGFEA